MTRERRDGHAPGAHDRERLRNLDVFASLSDAELQQILSVAVWRHYEPGRLITRPVRGGDVDGIVVEGRVRLLRISEAGRVLTEMDLGRGKVFDFGPLLALGNDDLVVEAVERTTICFIPWPAFKRAIVETPEAALHLIEQLRQERHELGSLAGDIALHDVPTRVRHALRALALSHPEHVIASRGEEIAARAGVSKEQVSRVMAELQRRSILVRRARGEFVVPDPDDLL